MIQEHHGNENSLGAHPSPLVVGQDQTGLVLLPGFLLGHGEDGARLQQQQQVDLLQLLNNFPGK